MRRIGLAIVFLTHAALASSMVRRGRSEPMMGEGDPQRGLFYQLSLESFVPAEHPLRAIRPLIDDAVIRRACRDLYAPIGRPSTPPNSSSWRSWAAICSA
jgi:hypothetical protein